MKNLVSEKYELAGYYRLEVRKAANDELVKDTGWFPNLITNAGLNQVAVGTPINRIYVGSGNTAPANTDTGMAAFVSNNSAVQATGTTSSAVSPRFSGATARYRFNPGTATGNLSEVGAGWGAQGSNTNIFSRALILDGGGAPTTLTVLSDEYLDVTYELRIYPNETDTTYTVNLSGTDYSITTRPANAGATGIAAGILQYGFNFGSGLGRFYDGTLGPITGIPNGSQTTNATPSANDPVVYSNNSYELNIGLTWGLNNAIGSNRTMHFISSNGYSTGFEYQHQFTPAIVKTTSQVLKLVVKYSWARRP